MGVVGGALYGVIGCGAGDCRSVGAENIIVGLGLIGVAGGAVIGWIVGAFIPDKVILIPQE